MTDLQRLLEDVLDEVLPPYGSRFKKPIMDAWGRRVLAEGREARWCLFHAASVSGQLTMPDELVVCDWAYAEDLDNDDCEIIDVLIVDRSEP